MKKIFCTYLTLALVMPAFASAQIVSETSAESDTGGNTSGSTKTGSASSSAHTTTVIDGSGNGTVEINVTTEIDGVIQNETIKKEVQGGVEVRVSTTSSSKPTTPKPAKPKPKAEAKAEVEVKAKSTFGGFASSTFWRNFPLWVSFTGDATTTVEIEDDGRVLTLLNRPHGTTTPGTGIRGFISKVFNIVIFWR